jgi:predicted enzyme related to lactoylglutathione lyase
MSDANDGRFVWYELLTTDPKAAMAFYTDVVGWKTQLYAEEGGYTMWLSAQGPLGGVTALPEAAKKMGMPSHWTAHVYVSDVDASVAKVRSLDGRVVMPPTDIPTIGRFAVISDPQGAMINVFKPLPPENGESMKPHDVTKPGEFCWAELMTTDHEAAFRFFSALFGWEKLSELDMGPGGKYLIFGLGEKRLGGMFSKGKDVPAGQPNAFLYYQQVADIDAATARATAKGARILNGPMEVPGGARIAQMMDPQGVAFALHEEARLPSRSHTSSQAT